MLPSLVRKKRSGYNVDMKKKAILTLTSLLTLICCFSACIKRNDLVCVDGWYVKRGEYQDVKPVVFNNFTLKAGLFSFYGKECTILDIEVRDNNYSRIWGAEIEIEQLGDDDKKLSAICKYDGEARFREVDARKYYKVVVSAAGYKTAVWDQMYPDPYSEFSMKVILQEDFDSILYQGSKCEETDLAQKGQCAVTGIITNDDGTPISRALVSLVYMTFSNSGWPTYGKVYRSASDEDGRYEICNVPPCERYIIKVEKQDYKLSGQSELSLETGKKTVLNYLAPHKNLCTVWGSGSCPRQ